MSEERAAALLRMAHEAEQRGEWQRAYELLTEADASGRLPAPALALLASVAYASGHLDGTIVAWERAHAVSLSAGDRIFAAGCAVRVAMHLLFDTALMASVRGWLKRAERLLEGHDDTSVHAWLAVVRNYERMLSGDFERSREWAMRAIALGERFDPAAAAIGRVAGARSSILRGEVTKGLEGLNEAAVATVSGEIDPLSTGVVYCELVCTAQALAQYDLAEQWTAAMDRWRRGKPVGSVHGRCRVHRAQIQRLRGAPLEAEREAMQAIEELRPYLRRELGWPLNELGRIRLQRGDLAGAGEAFTASHEKGWHAQPGLALVRLASGDEKGAFRDIRDALERPPSTPSKELPPHSDLRLVPLLEAAVGIAIAVGDLETAARSAGRLDDIAERFHSKPIEASAAFNRGRLQLATENPAAAVRSLDAAVQLWAEVAAPFELATARMELAKALGAEGNEERAALELAAARAGFERVGADHLAAETVRTERSSPGRGMRPAKVEPTPTGAEECVLRREGDYWRLVFGGRTALIRDSKGVKYLALLLRQPGKEVHAIELATNENAPGPAATGTSASPFDSRFDSTPILDPQAIEAYKRRLDEIEEDMEEARALGDGARFSEAEAEREFLVRELSRAVGLGGRLRRTGSASERARSSVTLALRRALARVREHHPALGQHLDRSVRTGTYCTYLPDPLVQIVWKTTD